MKVKTLSSANQDLVDGYWFYEEQKDGLGRYFLDSLFDDIDSLENLAGVHQVFFQKYYRKLSQKFPFAIYYQVRQDRVYVYAILDCRKNPSWIRKKIDKLSDI